MSTDEDDEGKDKATIRCFKWNKTGPISLECKRQELQIIKKEYELGD